MRTEAEIRGRIAELSVAKASNADAIKALRWVVEPETATNDQGCYVSRKPKFKQK